MDYVLEVTRLLNRDVTNHQERPLESNQPRILVDLNT